MIHFSLYKEFNERLIEAEKKEDWIEYTKVWKEFQMVKK